MQNAFSPPFYDHNARAFKVYDPRVIFDDVLGDGGAKEPVDIIDMAGAALRALDKRRLRIGPPLVVGIDVDTTEYSFSAVPSEYVIGADEGVDEGEFPIYDHLRKRFGSAIGKPKLVRIDDEESYADFRSRRRQQHIDELDERLARLETAFVEHAADDAAAFDRMLDGYSEGHDQQVVGAVVDAARGGKSVPLGLPHLRGKVECWLDGDEVLLSARMPGGIVTTGAPLQPEFEEVVSCAESQGCDPTEALVIGAQLAPSTMGRRLLGDLCGVARELKGQGVSALRPNADAGLAAAMALLQRCQRGDRQACREVWALVNGAGEKLIKRATKLLVHGQKQKALVGITSGRRVR